MNQEIPFFFSNNIGRRLFGILHKGAFLPGSYGKGTALVYCHPLFEEKLHAHRVTVNFARQASLNGFDVLRFDYYGDGDSEGLFQEASVETRIADIHSAIAEIRNRTGAVRILLIGLRMGAVFALLAGERSPDVSAVVAWAPVMNVRDYFFELLRVNLTAQLATHKKILEDRNALVRRIEAGGTVNVEGYLISREFYREAVVIDMPMVLRSFRVPVLAMPISIGAVRTDGLELFRNKNPQSCVEVVSVLERAFWTPQRIVYSPCEELFRRTLEWVVSTGKSKEGGNESFGR